MRSVCRHVVPCSALSGVMLWGRLIVNALQTSSRARERSQARQRYPSDNARRSQQHNCEDVDELVVGRACTPALDGAGRALR